MAGIRRVSKTAIGIGILVLFGFSDPIDPCAAYDRLYADIRDRHIDRAAAQAQVRALLPRIREYYYAHGGTDAPQATWRFPVAGYTATSIGGVNGSGYIPNGYDYFDGYQSHGHPAHDIFIRDVNHDELDDGTGSPVDVLSITGGIVVATATQWRRDSALRGGRYVYVYEPAGQMLYYYAHNRSVLVAPADIVHPGQVIAMVGRSGRNAAAARSPTHLHVMGLAIEDGYPRPRNIYPLLKRLGGAR
jgi:peptidoglycan LD-endopeptidase LytH